MKEYLDQGLGQMAVEGIVTQKGFGVWENT